MLVYAIEAWSNSVAVEHATNDENDDWWRNVDLKAVKQKFLSAVIACDLAGVVKIVEMPSNDARIAFRASPLHRFDLLHIDGSHAEEQALADVMDWLPLMAPGEIIVLDDIGWSSVAKARDYLRSTCTVLEEIQEGEVSYGAYRNHVSENHADTGIVMHVAPRREVVLG